MQALEASHGSAHNAELVYFDLFSKEQLSASKKWYLEHIKSQLESKNVWMCINVVSTVCKQKVELTSFPKHFTT